MSGRFAMTQPAAQPDDMGSLGGQAASLMGGGAPAADDPFADLASQVESLLNEPAPGGGPADEPPPEPAAPHPNAANPPPAASATPAPALELDDLAAQVASLIDSNPVVRPARAPREPVDPSRTPPAPDASSIDDLSSQVASLLGKTEKAGAEPESIQAIDGELAALTETLLADPKAASPPPAPHPEPPPAPPVASVPAAPAAAHATTPVSPTPPKPAADATPTTTPAPTPAPTAAPSITTPSAKARVVHVGGRAARLLAPVGAALGKPLASRPKSVRDSAGWLALWTLSCGAFVWVYALFLHAPHAVETPGGALTITANDEEAAAKKKAAAHRAALAAKEAEKSSHKDAEAKPTKTADAGGH